MAPRLLDDNGKLFYRPHPQYDDFVVDQFRIAAEHNCKNNETGDNTEAINAFFQGVQRR